MRTKLDKRIYLGIVLFFVLMTVDLCSADEVNIEQVGRMGGVTYDAAVDGDYAYIGQGMDLVVLNISDVSNPSEVGRITTPSLIVSIEVSGDYAYIADSSGLVIVNITDPEEPAIASILETTGYANDVAIAYGYYEGYAYVAAGDNGLVILDIKNPEEPEVVYVQDTEGYAKNVAIGGGYFINQFYAYVADDDNGLVIVDVSNPTAPEYLATYPIDDYANDVAVSGKYAYLTYTNRDLLPPYRSHGLEIVNISSRAVPTFAGRCETNTEGAAFSVTLKGNYAYIADGSDGLMIANVTDPTAPTLEENYDTDGYAEDVAVKGNYAYIADGSDGLTIANVTDPTAPAIEGCYDNAYSAWDVDIEGNYAYICSGYGLIIANITEPEASKFTGSYDTMEVFGNYVAVKGDYAYVADDDNGLAIVDVSNPAEPAIESIHDIGRYTNDVAVAGDNAYVANSSGLVIVNITDPEKPAITCELDQTALGVAVAGDYAYVADSYNGLAIVDISNPAEPAIESIRNIGGYARDVAVAGNYAYVANSSGGLAIVDVSNSAEPIITYDNVFAYHVAMAGDYAYITSSSHLVIVNITNPAEPKFAGSYVIPAGFADEIDAEGDYVYLADGPNGLVILHVSEVSTNSSPVADAGGPYQSPEGSEIIFNASSSYDPEGDDLLYRWDFESDGTWDTQFSENPEANNIWGDDWSGTVTLEVSDGILNTTDTASVTVNNVAPVVATITSGTTNINEGDTFIGTGSFTDPGTDTWAATVDYGDGTVEPLPLNLDKTFSLSHTYADDDDGDIYTVTVNVTDDEGDYGENSLTIKVNNVAPVLDPINTPAESIKVNIPVSVSANFSDPGILDTQTAVWDWGDGNTTVGEVNYTTGEVTGEYAYASPGIYWINLTLTDKDGGSVIETSENYVVIYAPESGFVTGSGWIDSPEGALLPPDENLTGKARFRILSIYTQDAEPSVSTEFNLKAADLNFVSTDHDLFVVAGAYAMYKGSGTINGEGEYGFIMSAVDGDIDGGDGVDRFRIMIWEISTGEIVYDNERGASEEAEPTTAIGGGSIILHKY